MTAAPASRTVYESLPDAGPADVNGIELHSIDQVPLSERHGRVSHLGAIWFVGNIQLSAMASGVTSLAVGAGLMWTVIATIIGSLFGTFFMAFHSAQGPQLGLPQLVQSRPQFGYAGTAITVCTLGLVNYVAYNTSDALLSGDAMHILFGMKSTTGYFVSAVIATAIALYGYRWIHRVNRWLTWPLTAIMIVLTVAALGNDRLPAAAFALGEFKGAQFATVFVIVAGFQLTWAPYVSDYSRYLPADVGIRATFWWTYLPSALSAIWAIGLGAVMYAAVGPNATLVSAIKSAGDPLIGGFGWIAVAAMLLSVISIMAMNQYGGMMSMISIFDSIKPIRPTRRARVIAIGVMFLTVWGIAQFVGIDRFNTFYGNTLIFLAYGFTPWTAINLVDYFFVRRGVYVVSEIFKPEGIYGRWGWRGNLAYGVSIVLMVPFMVTEPFTGFAAKALGGVDYSIFVGLPVAGLLYMWFSRSLDLEAERALAQAEKLGLERSR